MPPCQNVVLQDMHALMHELEALNAPHLPGYLGPFGGFKVPGFGGSKKTLVVEQAPAAVALSVKDGMWLELSGVQRKIVFQNAFKRILEKLRETEYDTFKMTLESNDNTKNLFEACINGAPVLE